VSGEEVLGNGEILRPALPRRVARRGAGGLDERVLRSDGASDRDRAVCAQRKDHGDPSVQPWAALGQQRLNCYLGERHAR